MDSMLVLGLQCSLSLLVFYLIYRWYVLPRTTKANKRDVLALLLLINVFRYLPLSLFMPGQVAEAFPPYLKEIVAHGDFLSGMLALIALILLKSEKKAALPFVWIFSAVSIVDMVVVLTLAMREQVYQLPLGANYFTVSVYVPLLLVTQWMILRLLLHKNYK